MVQLSILAGRKAGSIVQIDRFPWKIGRSAQADLRAEEDGIWEQHLELDKDISRGFLLRPQPDASVFVNGESVQETVLKNGDIIDAGLLKAQFWLGESSQLSLVPGEILTWISFAALCLAQLALIYWWLP